MDGSLFQGLRALAANIAIELPEAVADSGHYRVLMLTALVLFLFTFVLNTLAELIRQRLRTRYSQNQEGA
jgi:phosphate transport system permease protein